MIFKYPYTDMYALNLDWIIQAIKEMQETIGPLDRIVNSVNGMTGDVEITKALITQILGNLVETFNGRTGNVELTAEDVNNTLIDITWTSDPGDTIGDMSQSELDEMYLSGKRVLIFVNNLSVADTVYFLQYYDGHAQPQLYSPTSALAGVASFNGQTGNVTATGADLATSGTDSRTIAASLEDLEDTKVPVTRTVNNQPLSTNISINAANVPSQAITGATDVEMALGNLNASKVPNARQVNGKSLITDITLNDEDIPSDVDGQTNVADVLSHQSQQIDDLQAAAAYVENGDTASRTYTEGQFVLWKGLLYTVKAGGMPQGETISTTTYLDAVTGGGLNKLYSNIGNSSLFHMITVTVTTSVLGNANLPQISSDSVIVCTKPERNYAVDFIGRGGNGTYYAHIVQSNGDAVINTELTIDIYYVNL